VKKILHSKKNENGIQVTFENAEDDGNAFFSYAELIDMGVNALDLIQNPRIYRYDEKKRKIEPGRV
jgi:hypothetical protein